MGQANPHQSLELLRAYGLGKVAGADADTIAQHLETCADCQRVVTDATKRAALGPAAADVEPIPPALANSPDYEVLREISRGGMGVVYLARNRRMDRLEALKVVKAELLQRAGALERFEREMRAAARLGHSNIVTAYSSPPLDGLLAFAMEYVDGIDLQQLVKTRGPLPVSNACYYVYQAAQGLQHAFEQQMVHRDIKPNNLMLKRDGKKQVIKILDFGLAKATSENPIDGGLTGEGQMLGTPRYMAPEQIISAATADIRADIYSLGCTLYCLLTGEAPFQGKGSLYDILEAHRSETARPLHELRTDVPVELAGIVARMLHKDPAQRYQQPAEVAQALAPFFKNGVKPIPTGNNRFAVPPVAQAPPETASSKAAAVARMPMAAPAVSAPIPMAASDIEPTAAIPEAAKRNETVLDPVIAASRSTKTARFSAVPQWLPSMKSIAPRIWIGLAAGTVFMGLLGLWIGGAISDKSTTSEKDLAATSEGAAPESMRSAGGVPGSQTAAAAGGGLAEAQADWEWLFNGHDLNGWETHPGREGNWRVENGVLIGKNSSPDVSSLYTERDDFTDFHLRLEARINDGGHSSVCFRADFGPAWPEDNPQYPASYGVKIMSTGPGNKTGTLYASGPEPLVAVRETPIPPDQWFTLEIIASLNHIVVQVDGHVVADYLDEQQRFRSGRITVGNGANAVSEFRKIEILELPTTSVVDVNMAADLSSGEAERDPGAVDLDVRDRPAAADHAVTSPAVENSTEGIPDHDSQPAELLKSAKMRYVADVKRAEKTLAAQFDREIEALSKGRMRPEDRVHLVEAIKAEKVAFDTNKLIPWSRPMRPALLAYLKELTSADVAIRKAYDRHMATAIRAKDNGTLEALRLDLRSAAPRRLLARWNCTGVTVKNSWKWSLYSNGTFNLGDRSPALGDEWLWALNSNLLVVKTRHAKDPRVQFVDRCLISVDGSAFTAENNRKDRFAGTLDRSGN